MLSACLRSFPFGKELGRPGTVVRTGAVVYGRADGPHRPIGWLRFGSLNGSIGPDSGRGATEGLRMGLIFHLQAWTFLVQNTIHQHNMRNNGGVVGLNVLLAGDQHDFCIRT